MSEWRVVGIIGMISTLYLLVFGDVPYPFTPYIAIGFVVSALLLIE